MWANRTLDILIVLVAWIIIPIQLITTFILGLLVSATFGLLLYPISLVWVVCFLGPLLGISWVWERVRILRIPIGIIGIPIAFVGHIYTCLMPSMGELDSRLTKLILTATFPFTLPCWRMFRSAEEPLIPRSYELNKTLWRLTAKNTAYNEFLDRINVRLIRDSSV